MQRKVRVIPKGSTVPAEVKTDMYNFRVGLLSGVYHLGATIYNTQTLLFTGLIERNVVALKNIDVTEIVDSKKDIITPKPVVNASLQLKSQRVSRAFDY